MNRINIFGASGSGTSTLGHELARRTGMTLFDADDWFWQATDPPFSAFRDRDERGALMANALGQPRWILAGSISGWGDLFMDVIELGVFVMTPTPIRMARLAERERLRFGNRVLPGGDMHDQHQRFMAWAAQYDEGGMEMRSRQSHEAWLARLSCPILRVDGSQPLALVCDQVIEHVEMV